MKKVALVLFAMLIAVMGISTVALGAPGDYTYSIRVLQNGQPVEGVDVWLSGVGVETTGADGIAAFDISDAAGRGQGRQQSYRGPNYAAKKGKASGSVNDEYAHFRVTLEGPTFSMGTTVFIKLGEIYDIDI